MVNRNTHTNRSFTGFILGLSSIVVMGIFICLMVYRYNNPVIKEVIVEVAVEKPVTMEVSHKFNLTGVEYTQKVMNDVHVTSYNNHTNQTDSTPNITATSRPVREGIVAVSRDFLSNNWAKYGDLVYIDCFDKWYTIEDTMHERHTKHIDVFLFDKTESLKINKKCSIKIIHITK